MNTFTVSGMTCANCAHKVETTLKAIWPSAKVTLDPPRAIVEIGASVDTLNGTLAKIGKYRVSAEDKKSPADTNTWFRAYYPLFLVMALIALVSFVGGDWMMNFMGGFYIVFGAFKLLDVPSFANAYARYDVIAKVFKPWGYAYPFIETALGFAFLFNFHMMFAVWVALVLSIIGAIGVILANLKKQNIQCACLGTAFQLPMSIVTIIENLGMAAMAGWMLFSPQMSAGHDMSKMSQSVSATEGFTKAYGTAMDVKMKGMIMTPSGIPDQDFAKGAILHRQGAVDMAKVVLQGDKGAKIKKWSGAC